VSKTVNELCRSIASGEIEFPQEPPLFDWQAQLDDADDIIDWLRKPVPPRIGARRQKLLPGLDLGDHRESLARFLAELAEGYRLALDAYALRNTPDRPHRTREKNDTSDDAVVFKYAEYMASFQGDIDWDSFWLETYGRTPGNPGNSRTRKSSEYGPPIEPLRLNYPAIVCWWKTTTGGGFNPEFAAYETAGATAEQFERNNPPARFLLLVAWKLDSRYELRNVSGLYDTMRRQRRKAKGKA
jgi:hypothetical protein